MITHMGPETHTGPVDSYTTGSEAKRFYKPDALLVAQPRESKCCIHITASYNSLANDHQFSHSLTAAAAAAAAITWLLSRVSITFLLCFSVLCYIEEHEQVILSITNITCLLANWRELISLYQTSRSFWSSNQLLLSVSHANLTIGQCAFSYSSPVIWNAIPLSVRDAPSISTFKRRLKSFFFHSFVS